MPTPPDKNPSPLEQAVALVGDRWTLLLIDALLDEPRRFGDLQAAVGGIAPNILTQRLRALEQHGLVVARPYSEKPLRLTYEATASARDLAAALHLLADWGAQHGTSRPDVAGSGPDSPETSDSRNHCPSCGSGVEHRLWCPTCDRTIGAEEASDLRWA